MSYNQTYDAYPRNQYHATNEPERVYGLKSGTWSILELLTAIGIMIALMTSNGCTKALPESSKKLNTAKAKQQADRNYAPNRR